MIGWRSALVFGLALLTGVGCADPGGDVQEAKGQSLLMLHGVRNQGIGSARLKFVTSASR